jgi:hypothetical protein
MSIPIPLRRDFGAPRLRSLAKKTKDGPQARRLLTLAAIYDGASRTEAAKIGGVGLQIIRDYNIVRPRSSLGYKPPAPEACYGRLRNPAQPRRPRRPWRQDQS